MKNAKKAVAAGAAGLVLAATGALPALAATKTEAPSGFEASTSGSVFSGTIEIASTQGLLVERKHKKGSSTLISVDTDGGTVVSKAGHALSVEDLAKGAEVIVSGTKTGDGALLASKIIIRQ